MTSTTSTTPMPDALSSLVTSPNADSATPFVLDQQWVPLLANIEEDCGASFTNQYAFAPFIGRL